MSTRSPGKPRRRRKSGQKESLKRLFVTAWRRHADWMSPETRTKALERFFRELFVKGGIPTLGGGNYPKSRVAADAFSGKSAAGRGIKMESPLNESRRSCRPRRKGGPNDAPKPSKPTYNESWNGSFPGGHSKRTLRCQRDGTTCIMGPSAPSSGMRSAMASTIGKQI